MKTGRVIGIAAALAIVVGLIAYHAGAAPGQEKAAKAAETKKWEFKVVVQQQPDEKAISALGAEGWELVIAQPGQQYVKQSVVTPNDPGKGLTTTRHTIDYGRTVFVFKRAK